MEYLGVDERRRMYALARCLAEDWPGRFVKVCRAAGVTRSMVAKDMPFVPFALDVVLKEHLEDKPYTTSEAEVVATAAWLRKHRGTATCRDLKAHCGESRAAIYRHMDCERTPKTPSQWHSGRGGARA